MSVEKAERDLRQLIAKARKAMASELDTCVDWIDEESSKAKKIFEQIEKILRQSPGIDSKLFNETRDICDDLKNWIQTLTDHRNSVLNNEQRIMVQTLDELGAMNDGFKRNRKILFNK